MLKTVTAEWQSIMAMITINVSSKILVRKNHYKAGNFRLYDYFIKFNHLINIKKYFY